MRLLDDERGQSVQVGAAILLGFVVIAITLYQVEVVSSQNAEVEFNHDQEIREQLTELRNSINNAGTQGESDSVSVKLGGQYPPRTIFVNPPPIQGALETQQAGNISFGNAQVEGSYRGDGSATELVDGNHTTNRIVYVPRYFELDDAGVTSIEHSLAFKAFENNATDPLTRQRVVRGDSLTLTVLRGNLSEQGTQSISLDPETVSGPTDPITITNDSAGPIELYLPTATPSVWNETIGTEFGDNDARVSGYDGTRLTVELEPGEYDLQMAMVVVGEGVEETERYDVTDPGSGGRSGDGGSYDLKWDTSEMDSVTGLSCTAEACTYNIAQGPIPMTINTSPAVGGATVDYSVEFEDASGIAEFDPGSSETDGDGEARSEIRETGATDGDVVYVHANSGGDGDRLRVTFDSGALFDVSITGTNEPVTEGEELLVDATVENTGAASDSQEIILQFDGSDVDSRSVSLNESESESLRFSYNVSGASPGDYPIRVRSEDDADQSTVSVIGSGPFFEVRNLQVPSNAEPGDEIAAEATVKNVGSERGTQTIQYQFDGVTGSTTDTTLAPGEATDVMFTYTVPEDQPGGQYEHGVFSSNDSQTQPITVDVAPSVGTMTVNDRSTCSNGWCDQVRYDVSWSVSDENADLKNVTVNMYTDGGTLRDSTTTSVSGETASEQLTVSTQSPWTRQHTLEVVVHDEGERSDVEQRDETADGE